MSADERPVRGTKVSRICGCFTRTTGQDVVRSIHLEVEFRQILHDRIPSTSYMTNNIGSESDLWFSLVPLINSKEVEWHHPNRILRQFGIRQYMPQPATYAVAPHRLMWPSSRYWLGSLTRLIDCIVGLEALMGTPQLDQMPNNDPYMVWYCCYHNTFITHIRSGSPHVVVPPSPSCVKWWLLSCPLS